MLLLILPRLHLIVVASVSQLSSPSLALLLHLLHVTPHLPNRRQHLRVLLLFALELLPKVLQILVVGTR
jgi:hypothetical protein